MDRRTERDLIAIIARLIAAAQEAGFFERRIVRVLVPILVVAAVIGLAVWAYTSFRHGPQPPAEGPVVTAPEEPGKPPAPSAEAQMALGNPSGATDDPADRDNYLMQKPYFALSYNNSKGTANWVSWCLRASDLGPEPREEFYPDPDLPRSFKHVTPHDYTGTGFDRGHLCPRSDRTATAESVTATFAMTNIVPQSPHVNQRAWADLEDYCRELVTKHGQTLYLVAGPAGQGGEGSKGPADTIADGKVTVPAKCWKVALAVDGGTGGPEDAARVGPDSRLIAVIMPNDQSVGHGWARYRTSARDVEELTGYHFFDRVPAEVIGPLKASVDRVHVPAGRPHKAAD